MKHLYHPYQWSSLPLGLPFPSKTQGLEWLEFQWHSSMPKSLDEARICSSIIVTSVFFLFSFCFDLIHVMLWCSNDLECWWHFKAANGNVDTKENENESHCNDNDHDNDDDAWLKGCSMLGMGTGKYASLFRHLDILDLQPVALASSWPCPSPHHLPPHPDSPPPQKLCASSQRWGWPPHCAGPAGIRWCWKIAAKKWMFQQNSWFLVDVQWCSSCLCPPHRCWPAPSTPWDPHLHCMASSVQLPGHRSFHLATEVLSVAKCSSTVQCPQGPQGPQALESTSLKRSSQPKCSLRGRTANSQTVWC